MNFVFFIFEKTKTEYIDQDFINKVHSLNRMLFYVSTGCFKSHLLLVDIRHIS